jgi:hypothetical protein
MVETTWRSFPSSSTSELLLGLVTHTLPVRLKTARYCGPSSGLGVGVMDGVKVMEGVSVGFLVRVRVIVSEGVTVNDGVIVNVVVGENEGLGVIVLVGVRVWEAVGVGGGGSIRP